MFERSEFGCRAALGYGAQGTGDSFIVTGAAPVADGFGYFCLNKSDPRKARKRLILTLIWLDLDLACKGDDINRDSTSANLSRLTSLLQNINIHGWTGIRLAKESAFAGITVRLQAHRNGTPMC